MYLVKKTYEYLICCEIMPTNYLSTISYTKGHTKIPEITKTLNDKHRLNHFTID